MQTLPAPDPVSGAGVFFVSVAVLVIPDKPGFRPIALVNKPCGNR